MKNCLEYQSLTIDPILKKLNDLLGKTANVKLSELAAPMRVAKLVLHLTVRSLLHNKNRLNYLYVIEISTTVPTTQNF